MMGEGSGLNFGGWGVRGVSRREYTTRERGGEMSFIWGKQGEIRGRAILEGKNIFRTTLG